MNEETITVQNGTINLAAPRSIAEQPFRNPTTPGGEEHLSNYFVAEDQLQAMRQTLVVCAGGSGVRIGTQLKARLLDRFGKPIPPKIRLVAFDTTREPFAVLRDDEMVELEEGAELFVLNDIPVARIIRHLHNHPSIEERLGGVVGNLQARVLRDGAKSNRALGLLALYWKYGTVVRELRKAIRHLVNRETLGAQTFEEQAGLNVFIAAGLGGGTGSGTFLDLAYIVRSLVEELGIPSEFCRITGVGILPLAFPGVPNHTLYPNTAAALQELNHAMVNGNFQSRYPDGRSVDIRESPFHLFYVLDGVDERGQVWSGIDQVTAMAAEAIALQMVSQLGQNGDNVFDNLDDVLAGMTDDGYGTFLGSVGQAVIEFPAPAVAELCSLWLLDELITRRWLAAADNQQAAAAADSRLQAVSAADLLPLLLQDPQTGGELHLELRQPAWLLDKRHDEIATEAARYVRQFGHVRLTEGILGQMMLNGQAAARQQGESWQAWVDETLFAPASSVHQVLHVLQAARKRLAAWSAAARQDLAEQEQRIEAQKQEVAQRETTLAQVASGLPFGRTGRVRAELNRFFQEAQTLYTLQQEHGCRRVLLQVWGELDGKLEGLERTTRSLGDRLETIARQVNDTASEKLRELAAGDVATISLADEPYVRTLYARTAPHDVAISTLRAFAERPREARLRLSDMAALSVSRLREQLLTAVSELFDPLRRLTVEDVILERADEMSPRARRQQLFQLAAPSWSVDWTRLREGGAELKRLELLGVPDATNSCFAEEPLRVSTHDPQRVVALVIHVGAPVSALQQFDRYEQALERVRGHQPVHVLPAFITHANQGRLAFALGSIFGLIESKGRYFYYQPADTLQSPVLLGNGLAVAVEALVGQEALAREVSERVEGLIARVGVQTAIERLTEYVSAAPKGRSGLDEVTRELKRLVRDYMEELVEIHALGGSVAK